MEDWFKDPPPHPLDPCMLDSLLQNGIEQCVQLALHLLDSQTRIENTVFYLQLIQSRDAKAADMEGRLYDVVCSKVIRAKGRKKH